VSAPVYLSFFLQILYYYLLIIIGQFVGPVTKSHVLFHSQFVYGEKAAHSGTTSRVDFIKVVGGLKAYSTPKYGRKFNMLRANYKGMMPN
jgi:hypothetical protein